MSKKRFELRLCSNGTYYVYENGELVIDHISFDRFNKDDANALIGLLNEQQDTITELERKLNKYAKIGEEQLKQIIELQEENEQLKKARDESDKFIVKKGLEIEFLEWCIK